MVRHLVMIVCLAWAALTGAARAGELYQVSLLTALMRGVYDGETSIAELSRHGDFGLGTVNGLDGEMIALDGRFFRGGTDGLAVALPDEARTPFAMVTPFTADLSVAVPAGLDLAGLEAWLAGVAPLGNQAQAIRVEGRFTRLVLRSVPRQQPPYPPLLDALRGQVSFALSETDGTLIGFRLPAHVRGQNAPGFHFHFIDAAHRRGGHVLALVTGGNLAGIARLNRITIDLPADAAFAAANLGDEGRGGANAVEGQ